MISNALKEQFSLHYYVITNVNLIAMVVQINNQTVSSLYYSAAFESKRR